MDQLHATLHKASRSVRMDPHARDGFRRTLEAITSSAAPVASPAGFRLPKAFGWALAALVVAASGASVTYAATRAVPGDALYGMKVNVIEPTETALALSADAKAQVAVAHLERRFREAAELSATGSLEAHDEQLAALAARDVAAVDRDDQPVARARFEALAATYGPPLTLNRAARSRFAAAVRLGDVGDIVPDDIAAATAREQLAIAQDHRAAASANQSAAVAIRVQASDRLAKAASQELEKGSFRAALELSGAAAKVATEAQLFAAMTTSTPEATTTASTTVTATSTATTTPVLKLFR